MRKNSFYFLTLINISIITLLAMVNNSFTQDKFPNWAKGIVWYQIFPERFANGDKLNDPTPDKVFVNQKKIPEGWTITPWTSNWFAESDWEKKFDRSFRERLTSRRYGGDIQGIINKLDYLQSLGIGAIYLNPIFDAVSMHKYDGSTYHHIDINFGPDPQGDKKIIENEIPDDPTTWQWTSADKLFLQLINEVHKRGMHIIIDGVFNHTGIQFWAFQDIIKNGKNSKYFNWYKINSLDDPSTPQDEFDYKGWWGTKSLPEFNRTKDNLYPEVKNYIFNATKRWMDPNGDGNFSDGIDGWRLDVAREVPLGFWKEWNQLVKSINPNAIIIGELWEISSDFISANGVFDALMNYNFAFAINDFFINQKKKITTEEFIKRLKEIDKSYPENNLYILQNLLDSHDTDRLSSIILNPDREYDRDSDERNPNYNPRKPNNNEYEFQKLIVAFQMTYRGAPMIYYGDEVGMWGADDPHDRKPMVWDDLIYDDEVITENSGFKVGLGSYKVNQNKNLLDYYKKIISIRNNSKALKFGDVEFLIDDKKNHSFGFMRKYEDEKIINLFNLENYSVAIKIPSLQTKNLFDVFNNSKVELNEQNEIILKPKSFLILKEL
ncbi:MAG: glycoside hydrolase family 13 protein [Ignavibacterium sp.]